MNGYRRLTVCLAVCAVAACGDDTAGPTSTPHLAFDGTPQVVGSGEGFSPAIMVTVRDEFGALVTDWSTTVELSLTGSGVSLGGTTTAVPTEGVAVFADLRVHGSGSGVRLTAGSGDLEATSEAFEVPGSFSAETLVAGSFHTCALDQAGVAWCWGRNARGQLGDGTQVDRSRPTRVAGGVTFAALSAEGDHTCALTSGGVVYCWGGNGVGQTGTGGVADILLPTRVALSGTAVQVDAGAYHTCALTDDGAAWCWGYNPEGKLGTGSGEGSVTTPEAVMGGLTFASVTAGFEHTCGLTPDGAAYCWGWNMYGDLGDGTQGETRAAPQSVLGDVEFATLVAGGGGCHGQTCGVGADGTTYCWGKNYQRGLGPTSDKFTTVPTPVVGAPEFVEVIPGPVMVCGLDAQGAMSCWGEAYDGQLANGSTVSVQAPTPVLPGESIRSVAMGMEHVCVSTASGKTWCWGTNTSGQLGNPSNPLGWLFPVPVWAAAGG